MANLTNSSYNNFPSQKINKVSDNIHKISNFNKDVITATNSGVHEGSYGIANIASS